MTPEVRQVLQTGDFHALHQDEQLRRTLTSTCQLCSKSYSRTTSLPQHLQQQHSPTWQAAKGLQAMLTKSANRLCFCFPVPKAVQNPHICLPPTQLAMVAHHMDFPLMVPQPLPPQRGHRLPETLTTEAKTMIQELLAQPAFNVASLSPQQRYSAA